MTNPGTPIYFCTASPEDFIGVRARHRVPDCVEIAVLRGGKLKSLFLTPADAFRLGEDVLAALGRTVRDA